MNSLLPNSVPGWGTKIPHARASKPAHFDKDLMQAKLKKKKKTFNTCYYHISTGSNVKDIRR